MVVEFTVKHLCEELGEKHSKHLAGASRRSDQRISSGLNGRPGPLLHLSRLVTVRCRQLRDERMKTRERHGAASYDTLQSVPIHPGSDCYWAKSEAPRAPTVSLVSRSQLDPRQHQRVSL